MKITRFRPVVIRALILVAALVIAFPAAADLVGMRQLEGGVSGKPASGFFASLTQSNLKESRDLTPELRWGNDDMHQRYYSPVLGRFVSVDPVAGEVGVSQSNNRYSYVLNNPIKLVDPDGKTTFVFTVEPGNGLFEMFGHSAIFVVGPDGRHAGISYGGSHDFSGGLDDFVRAYNAENRAVAMTLLDTTPEQETKMIDFLEANPSGGTNREAIGADQMIRENCAQAVGNTLEAGEVVPKGSNPSQVLGGLASTPGNLVDAVTKLKIDVGTIVMKPDDSQERENFLELLGGIDGSDE